MSNKQTVLVPEISTITEIKTHKQDIQKIIGGLTRQEKHILAMQKKEAYRAGVEQRKADRLAKKQAYRAGVEARKAARELKKQQAELKKQARIDKYNATHTQYTITKEDTEKYIEKQLRKMEREYLKRFPDRKVTDINKEIFLSQGLYSLEEMDKLRLPDNYIYLTPQDLLDQYVGLSVSAKLTKKGKVSRAGFNKLFDPTNFLFGKLLESFQTANNIGRLSEKQIKSFIDNRESFLYRAKQQFEEQKITQIDLNDAQHIQDLPITADDLRYGSPDPIFDRWLQIVARECKHAYAYIMFSSDSDPETQDTNLPKFDTSNIDNALQSILKGNTEIPVPFGRTIEPYVPTRPVRIQ